MAAAIDPALRAALAASNLRGLPGEALDPLLADARRIRVPAGTSVHREENPEHVELLVEGLTRVYVSARDGRTLTIRYCRPGALLGVATLFAGASGRPFAVQALVDAELLRFRPETVRRVADRDLRVTTALLSETSDRVISFIGQLADTAFSSVRRRVARRLLDLASEGQQEAGLVARVTQQELADAVGAVREVVVPVLRELREAGIVRTERGGIAILRPDALLEID